MEVTRDTIQDAKCIERRVDEQTTALFWIDFTPTGATIRPYLKRSGASQQVSLIGIPTDIDLSERAQALRSLQESVVEVVRQGLLLLPPTPSSRYEEWMQRRQGSSDLQERAELQDKINLVEGEVKALQSALHSNDRKAQMIACNDLGAAYKFLGEFYQSITCFREVLSLAVALDHSQGKEAAYSNLGAAYYSLGEYRKAIECHQQQLAIALRYSPSM